MDINLVKSKVLEIEALQVKIRELENELKNMLEGKEATQQNTPIKLLTPKQATRKIKNSRSRLSYYMKNKMKKLAKDRWINLPEEQKLNHIRLMKEGRQKKATLVTV